MLMQLRNARELPVVPRKNTATLFHAQLLAMIERETHHKGRTRLQIVPKFALDTSPVVVTF